MAPRRRATRRLKIPRSAEGRHRSRRRSTGGHLFRHRGLRAILWGQQGHFVPHGANVDVDAALILAENALLFGHQEDLGHNLAPVLPMGPQLQDGELEELQDLFGIEVYYNLPPVLLPIGPRLVEAELEKLEYIFGKLGELPDLFGIGAGYEDAVYGFELDEAFDLDDLVASLEDYNPFSVLLDIEKASELDAGLRAILWGQQGHFVPHGANVDVDTALILAENALLFGYQEDLGHNLAPVLLMGPQLQDGEFEELQDLFGIGADNNLAPVLLPIGPQLLDGELEELEDNFRFEADLRYYFGIGDGNNLGELQELQALQDLFGIEELQDLFRHNLAPVPPLDPQLLNGIGAGYEDAVHGFELDEAFDLDDLVASLEDYNPFSVLLDIENASELDAGIQDSQEVSSKSVSSDF